MVHAWDKLLHKQQQQQDTSLEGGAAPAGKPTIIPDYYSGSYASTSIPSSASSSGSNPSTSAQAYYGTTHYQPSKQTVEAMRGAMMTGGVDSVAGKFDNKYQAKQEFKDIASKKFFRPKCDVVEGQRGATIFLELPGVPKDGIKIDLQGNNLHIYGFAPDFRSLNDKCAISERSFGHFSREYIIPDSVLYDNIKTDYCHGLLTVYLPWKAMNLNTPAPMGREVTAVSFAFYSTEEIRRLSVKSITNPVLMDTMNHPSRGGLYDSALGPLDKKSLCTTCSLGHDICPGHMGHIDLAMPVYNPVLFSSLYRIIRSLCPQCYQLRVPKHQTHKVIAVLKLIDHGLLIDAAELEATNFALKKPKKAAKGKKGALAAADKRKQKKGKASFTTEEAGEGMEEDEEEEEDDDDDDENVPEEPMIDTGADGEEEPEIDAEALMASIDAFVKDAIHRAKDTPRGNNRPTVNAHEYRRQVVASYFRSIPAKRCQNCQTFVPNIRKDGTSKLFEVKLPKKLAMSNLHFGREIKPLFEDAAKSTKRTPTKKNKEVDEDGKYQMDDMMDEDDIAEDEEDNSDDTTGDKAAKTFLMPFVVREMFRRLWDKETVVLDLMFGTAPSTLQKAGGKRARRQSDYNNFFIEIVPVPPTRFRPASIMGDKQFEHPQNTHLTNILKTNIRLLEVIKPQQRASAPQVFDLSRAVQTVTQLQVDVNCLIDSTQNKDAAQALPAGIKQVLEKKEGLFRKHMMGKRVNYAARSVISPDPYIETSEIGVPMVFAKKLTYPEPVTEYNVKLLRQAVINGPSVYPGASQIHHENGSISLLSKFDREQRIALANQLLTPQSSSSGDDAITQGANKKVLRHLRNGDVLLVNRQPTLHKPSMMAHIARVLPGERTIRMHYANCNTYNADFDGDEMNMHFPQNELARAELYTIANTDNQYLVPTDGKPIRGLIQDHVVTGVLMTMRGSFFTRENYQQLLFGSLPDACTEILTVPPCIMKPQALWSGKQLITTVMLNLTKGKPQLNLTSGARIPVRAWDGGNPVAAEESTVVFCEGDLVQGVIDKNQFGATAFGMVHAVFELYGPKTAGQLLTTLGRLFIKYIQFRGFTCRMDDLLLKEKGDEDRRDLLSKVKPIGHSVASEFVGLGSDAGNPVVVQRLEPKLRDDREAARLDGLMKGKTGEIHTKIIDSCLPLGQLKPFRDNHMSLMIHTGAKGSNVNLSQISCLLGQQELEGRRVPRMVSGKTLPSFRPYETAAIAGGFIGSRFLTGLKPQEFFFHCMAGREGLIDTAVKTSRSGYLQRCLVKHLEGLKVHYDQTVRDSDGSIVQFHYGEDSLDVTKTKYLHKFDFSAQNYQSLIRKFRPDEALAVLELEKGPKYAKRAAKAPAKNDPVLARLNPALHLGAISEHYNDQLEKFLEKSGKNGYFERLNRFASTSDGQVNAEKFQALMWLRYVHSLVEPGEVVGLLAAQSIGEPSTQMTLNTFHFAGVGAKNVTLGIPRLREIIMTASSKIKTPFMELPLKAGATEKDATQVSLQLMRLTLDTVISDVTVTQTIRQETSNSSRQRVYQIQFKFIPVSAYTGKYALSKDRLKFVIGQVFTRRLLAAIKKELKLSSKHSAAELNEIGQGMKVDGYSSSAKSTSEEGDAAGGEDDEGPTKPSKRSADDDNSDSDDDDDEEAAGDEEAAVTKSAAGYDKDSAADKDEDDEDAEEDGEPKSAKKTAQGKGKSAAAADEEDDEEQQDENDTSNVLAINSHIVGFEFAPDGTTCTVSLQYDLSTRKLLMVSLVEREAGQTVVRQVKGISRCFVEENEKPDDKSITLGTEGVNFAGVWELDSMIDINRIQSNDIRAILDTYGVEAARNTITREVAKVFAVYGISVDPRHLTLVADHMTFEGGYRAMNRMGMEHYPSAFQKMSFETTMHFLRSAAMSGEVDYLQSPSSRIVLGKPVYGGTGSFDILQPLGATA